MLQYRHPRKHFVAWNYPIHWNGMAVTSRADQAQRSGAACSANNQNIAAFNNLTASETITLLFK